MRYGNAQHIGAREEQQDASGVSDQSDANFVIHGGVVGVVCDGIGGLAAGSTASRTAVQTFLESYLQKPPSESIPEALRRSVLSANDAVFRAASSAGLKEQSGTTLVAVCLRGNQLYWASVGDSRAYIVRRAFATQITRDHTFANFLDSQVEQGTITKEQALKNPDRGALTSFIGVERLSQFDVSEAPTGLKLGDYLVVCSDGVYRALPPEEITSLCRGEPQEVAERLINTTLGKQIPKQDNLTALVLRCEEGGAPVPLWPFILGAIALVVGLLML